MTITPLDIMKAVEDGVMDERIDELYEALKTRRKINRMEKAEAVTSRISTGDQVRLVDVKPKYLEGTIATVRGVKNTRLVVEFDEDPSLRRWSGAKNVRVPASSVEIVPSA